LPIALEPSHLSYVERCDQQARDAMRATLLKKTSA
jgi:hypothetical protein